MTARRFEILVEGLPGVTTLRAFSDLDVAVEENNTVIRGEFIDQEALREILERVSSLGLDLLEVRPAVVQA